MSRSPCWLHNDRKVACRIARIRLAGAVDCRLTSPMQKTRRKPRPLPHSDWRTKYGILLGVSTTAPCGVLSDRALDALCCRRDGLTLGNDPAQHVNHVANAEDPHQRMLLENGEMANPMAVHLFDHVRQIIVRPA